MKKLNVILSIIFLMAFLIRLISLNQSLWLDEAVTANVVKNFSFMQIITKFSPTDFHPPLYYLFMKLWTNAFGYSEIALRVPSILFSLITGYVIYKICRLRQGFGEPLWAAVFFLFNPLIIYYSQEARMYMMATLFLTLALYFFISNIKNKISKIHIKNQIFFTLFISLSFLTFYGSIFLITPMLLYFLYKKQYKVFILNTGYFILVTFLIFPLFYQQFVNSKIALANVTNWSSVLGKSNIKNLFLIPVKFSIGRISFYPKWVYWGISGAWTGYIIYQILKLKNQKYILKIKNFNLLFYLFILTLILGFAISFFVPMLQYFRFLYLIPIVCILLSFGLSSQSKFNRPGWILAGGFIIFSLVYLLNPQFHREDWKNLVKNLPKDSPLYMITASSDPVKYYNNNLNIKELRIANYGLDEKQITVIPYTTDIYGFDYKKNLKEKGYILSRTSTFRELFFEEWKRL